MTDTPATETGTTFENPTSPQGGDDSSTAEPATITIEATFEALEIEAEQRAYLAEHPDTHLLTVEFFQGLLKSSMEDAAKTAEVSPGTGSYETRVDDPLDNGITVHLLISVTGASNALVCGNGITDYAMNLLSLMIDDLETDPLGVHRREHLQELKELEVGEDELAALNTVPLGVLCGLVDAYAMGLALMPDSWSASATPENTNSEPTKAKKRGFWASVVETLRSYFED